MLLLLLNLLACSDYTMVGKPSEQDILAFPAIVDFGHLESGHETGTEQFTIINSGQRDLVITTPVLVQGEDRFSLGDIPDQQWTIAPQENIIFDVTYDPKTFESNGAYIEIASDDPDEPVVRVELVGYGDAPVANVSPLEFNYGDISIGCDNEERLTITNDGNLPLVIENITQMVTQPMDILMEYGTLLSPPWVIEPGYSLDFLVSYVPTDVGSDESEIKIISNDPYNPEIETIQYGDGDVEQWFSENHIQEEIPVLDILWVVDDSGSMNRFQTSLSSNVGLFIQAFTATGADYHMAVITTTHSMIGVIIDNTTPNAETVIANEVIVGVRGAGNEYGLQKSQDALNDPNSAGRGGAFFRNNATLIVIYVSDEPDHSPSWTPFVTFFNSLKPAGKFVPYAVIGDPPGGCTNLQGYGSAQYGSGYWDLVDYYGGSWYSICSTDWGVQLESMANQMSGRSSYELEERDPIVDTIVVSINGQVVTDWEYDVNTNSVRFPAGHIPEPGQVIGIDYAIWGC